MPEDSSKDRSWTITPTLLWFASWLVALLFVLDGGVTALADRITVKRDDHAGRPIGPVVTAPVQVAQADTDDASDDATAHLPPAPAGSRDSGALTDTCIDPPKCTKWAMDGFYRAVAEARRQKLGRAVRVSWYGDSVVATDMIPGKLRTLLQAELGDGGPGFVFIVPPHRFNNHEAITRSSSGSWFTHAISTMQVPDGLYGPGGSTTESDGGRSTIKLVAGKVTNLELYYLAKPKGGVATVAADGTDVMKVDTSATATEAAWQAATVKAGAAKLDVKIDKRVRLFGLDLENATGAVVDNFGVVSVNVKSFGSNNVTHWQTELGHRGADLIMIMIGANEAEWLGPHDQDTKDYQAHYEKVLEIVRKGRPDASCLVVSPTDQAEAKDDAFPSRPVMPVLVEAQKQAAQAQGCAFFSTYAWMGGKGSAAKWFKKGLVSGDFQHLSKRGADKLATAVYDALMDGAKKHAGDRSK
jgi:lysophospholipase L1-like esterase